MDLIQGIRKAGADRYHRLTIQIVVRKFLSPQKSELEHGHLSRQFSSELWEQEDNALQGPGKEVPWVSQELSNLVSK